MTNLLKSFCETFISNITRSRALRTASKSILSSMIFCFFCGSLSASFEAYILVEDSIKVSTIFKLLALSDEPVLVLSIRICAKEASLSWTKPSLVPQVRKIVPFIFLSLSHFLLRFWYSVAMVTGCFESFSKFTVLGTAATILTGSKPKSMISVTLD